MGIEVAPSAIDRHLRVNRLRVVDEDGIEWELRNVFPVRAGMIISPKLTPLLERLVDEIRILALQLLEKENRHRKGQSLYELKRPKPRHYSEAAETVTKAVLKYISQDSLFDLGGEQRGEADEPNERSESTDPHGGDLE